MAGINPVSGSNNVIQSNWSQASGQIGKKDTQPKATFAEVIRGAIDTVDQDQANSSSALQELLAGRRQDTMAVATQVAKADMSFKLLMGVRNKVIEAYKQTMNMQV